MTRRIRFSPLVLAGALVAGAGVTFARASEVPFVPQPVQFPGGNSAARLYTTDLDRDGDLDVVQVEENGDRVGWFDNADGLGG
jgi:hypothetical protein